MAMFKSERAEETECPIWKPPVEVTCAFCGKQFTCQYDAPAHHTRTCGTCFRSNQPIIEGDHRA